MVYAIIGDIHGDIAGMYKYLLEWQERTGTKVDAVIQVGDFGLYRYNITQSGWGKYWNGEVVAPIPTWVCPGNHEGWREIADWMLEPEKVPNIHLLTDGAITDIMGLKVGAIWGNFSPFSYYKPERVCEARNFYETLLSVRNCNDYLRALHIYKPSVERLQAAGGVDLLITHDGPVGLTPMPRQPPKNLKQALGLASDEPCMGCPDFQKIYTACKPTAHFFGHFHSFKIMQEANPLVVALHNFNFKKEDAVWMWEA